MAINYKSETKFTAIGLSGSGKTCYIMGLYDQMSTGVNGFNLITTNNRANQLEDMLDILDNTKGQDRFPSGTTLNKIEPYQFILTYKTQAIMAVDWIDYGGNILHDKGESVGDVYTEIEKSIEQSSALYIFIDGNLLCFEDTEAKVRQVSRRCARKINPYIVEFSQKHDDCLPPVIFVITKSDLCAPYIRDDELNRVIEACFSNVYLGNYDVYITAVSYGAHISDNNYSGDAEPNMMYLPFLLGMYHEYQNKCQDKILYLNNRLEKIQSEAMRYKNVIKEENQKWFKFLIDHKKVSTMQNNIKTANIEKDDLLCQLEEYKRLLKATSDQLLRDSDKFTKIKNGHAVLFETNMEY